MKTTGTEHIDSGYRLLGCQYIRKQLDALAQHTHGCRTAEDVEDVHQARVASRRMRAALSMFGSCFPARDDRTWQRRIRLTLLERICGLQISASRETPT